MRIFATRVWGFQPSTWPLITFNLEGNRDSLLRNSSIGDKIVFIATQGEPTRIDERGRILGIAEIGRIPIDTLKVLPETSISPEDYDEKGNFRWPKALAMTKAWTFIKKPLLKDVLSEQLPYNATSQAVLLNEKDTAAIQMHQIQELEIPTWPAIRDLKLLDEALLRGKNSKGITPTAWSSEITRSLGKSSVTYVMRFGKTNCWKIGYTADVKQRKAELNKHIPYELLRAKWEPFRIQKWDDEIKAFEMEQKLLNDYLKIYATENERVVCEEVILHNAWLSAIGVK